MGSGASTARRLAPGRRYLLGKRPELYFEQVILPEMRETFDMLRLDVASSLQLFLFFVEIDDDNSGEVGLDEFHKFLGISKTRYSERVFSVLDLDMGGSLDFKEFLVGVWNCCTYGTNDIAQFVHDIFDIDNLRELTLPEFDAMLRMLYGTEEADPGIMKILRSAATERDTICYEKFKLLCARHAPILQPAFDLQRSMRRAMLGIKFWEAQAVMRADMCRNEESTSWEAVAAIMHRKQEERLAKAAEDIRIIEEEAAKELAALCEDENEAQGYIKMRLLAQKEKKIANRLPEEVVEKERWTVYAQLKEEWAESQGWDVRAAARKNALRRDFWVALEAAIAATEASVTSRSEVRRRIAAEEDGPLKAEAWLKSKVGASKFDMLVARNYGRLVRGALEKSGPISRSLAPAFEDGSLVARWARRFPNAKMMEEAKDGARTEVVERFKAQELQEVSAKLDEEKRVRESEFAALYEDAQAAVGSRSTKWERLLNGRQHCLCNADTGEIMTEKTKICPKCDSIDTLCEC
jgi:Ca2+-binding EF-hand superfamily protein